MSRTLRDYPEVSLRPEDLDCKVDFVQIFGRRGAVHIEIGTGKGTFLLNEAKAQPHVNFLGMERARKYYRYAVDRIGRWALANVRIIRTDAAVFIADSLADSSVDCFHIYFPDPWPKRRHHKRRFFCRANMQHLIRCLKADGQLRIATDHAEYSGVITDLLLENKDRLEPTEFVRPAGTEQDEWVGTNYERKYIKDQRAIYTIAARKTG